MNGIQVSCLADRFFTTERLQNHPMALTRRDIEAVYRQAFRPILDPERQACLDIWRYYGA